MVITSYIPAEKFSRAVEHPCQFWIGTIPFRLSIFGRRQHAWRQRQFCLVPLGRFFEPCWETGKAVPWSIHRQDGEPFTVAGIWDRWNDRATGEIVVSFSMLTINADGHPIMGRFHRPGDERRSLVVIPHSRWAAWLSATSESAAPLLAEMPVDQFTSEEAEPPKSQLALL